MTTSQARRVNVITRQRLLSDDFNNTGRMYGRSDALHSIAAGLGNAYLDNAIGKGGVVGGFLVECIPGTNRVKVLPGLGYVESTPTSPTFDPPVAVLDMVAEAEIDLTAYIDPGSPRLVVIEIEPAEVTLVTGVVDVFDPGTGIFGFDPAAARVTGSQPILSVNAGAAAANPVVPVGPSGKLPLAVVKLVAAQASFADAYAPVLMCRPLLYAESGHMAPDSYVRGGGVGVGEESGGALINLTDCYINKLSCSLLGLDAEVAGLILFATLGRTFETQTTATLLGTRQPVYAYAVAPPWRPADYGTIAPREAWQRNPNQVPYASTQNIVGGSGPTFTSLSAETATSPGLTHRNAIVVWDNIAPYGAERGAGNAPIQIVDARGPHPDHAPGGPGILDLEVSQDVAWGNAQTSTDSVYIGSVAALNLVASFMGQAVIGSGLIRITDVSPPAPNNRRPLFTTTVTVGLTSFYPGRFPTMLVGDTEILPPAAQQLDLWATHITGAGGVATVSILPNVGFGAGSATGGWSLSYDTVQSGTVTTIMPTIEVQRDAADACLYSLTNPGGGTLIVTLTNYVDAFLASR